jgi:NDP-sugar pyrophosphorylase family protein
MPNLFQQLLIENKKVIAFPIHENWEDIGRPRDLEKANFDFNNRSN